MPINVQPSIVTDPAAVVQRSAQVENEAAAQAFRNAQVGQERGQQGLDTAIQSTAALARQRARENAQKRAQIGSMVQQGISAFGSHMRDIRKEKVDLAREQRMVEREMDEQKMNEFPAAMQAISEARIKATDADGNIDPDYAAKLDQAEASIVSAYDGNKRSLQAKAMGQVGQVMALAGQQSDMIAKQRGDELQRDMMTAQQFLNGQQQNEALTANYLAVSLESTDTSSGIAEASGRVKSRYDELSKTPAGEDISYIAKNLAPAVYIPVHASLDAGAQEFADAMAAGNTDHMRKMVEEGRIGEWEGKLLYAYGEKMFEARAVEGVSVSRFDDQFDQVPGNVKAAVRENLKAGRLELGRLLAVHPNLSSGSTQEVSMVLWEKARGVEKASEGKISAQVAYQAMNQHLEQSVEPIKSPPAMGYNPPAPTAESAPLSAAVPGAAEPEPAPMGPQQEPDLPPDVAAAKQAREVLLNPIATQDEKREAASALADVAIKPVLFTQAVGGDQQAADLLSKTAATLPGVRQRAERMGVEERAKADEGWWHPGQWFADEGEKVYWRTGSAIDAARRASFGETIGKAQDEELAPAILAAAAKSEGKVTDKEAKDLVVSIATKMGRVYREQAKKRKKDIAREVKEGKLAGARAAELRKELDAQVKRATQNALSAYRELTKDGELSSRLIPDEVLQMVRGMSKSELKQQADEQVRAANDMYMYP